MTRWKETYLLSLFVDRLTQFAITFERHKHKWRKIVLRFLFFTFLVSAFYPPCSIRSLSPRVCVLECGSTSINGFLNWEKNIKRLCVCLMNNFSSRFWRKLFRTSFKRLLKLTLDAIFFINFDCCELKTMARTTERDGKSEMETTG